MHALTGSRRERLLSPTFAKPASVGGLPLTRFRPLMTDEQSLRLALFTETWTPQVNGVARTLERLRDAVIARGGDVLVVTADDPDARAEPNVYRAPSAPFWAYPQLRLAWPTRNTVSEVLRAFSPTLVHVATEFGVGLAGRSAAQRMQLPLVTSYHTNFTAYAQYYSLGMLARPGWQYLRWFHSAGARTYCPTQSIVREVQAQGFQNCAVWSRGVDTQRFSPMHKRSALREQLGIADDVLLVTYVGRIAAEKGLDVALHAMRLAAQARPGKIAFAVIGDGPFEQETRARTPEPRWIPGKLLGAELSTAYASSDLFLFPSTTDTFGNVLLEAMASGLPVVGADVGPTRELIGETRGWLVAPGNAEAMAAALVQAVDEPALRYERATAALEFAGACSWDGVWDRLFQDYLRLQQPNRPVIAAD